MGKKAACVKLDCDKEQEAARQAGRDRAQVVVLQCEVAEIDKAKHRSKYSPAKRKWAGGELYVHFVSLCPAFANHFTFSVLKKITQVFSF